MCVISNNLTPSRLLEPSLDRPMMPAFAGFRDQMGTPIHSLPGSGTEQILMLSNSSNIGEPGVWVFRIDNEIQPGGMYIYVQNVHL